MNEENSSFSLTNEIPKIVLGEYISDKKSEDEYIAEVFFRNKALGHVFIQWKNVTKRSYYIKAKEIALMRMVSKNIYILGLKNSNCFNLCMKQDKNSWRSSILYYGKFLFRKKKKQGIHS